MRLRLVILMSMVGFITVIGIIFYYVLAPHVSNYFYLKSIENIQKSDYLQARINYEKSLFLSDEFANPNTTGFIQVYLAYARDLSNKAQQDSKTNISRHLNQAIRAYERAMSFKVPLDLAEVINIELANTYYTCASKQVSCKYESDVITNYQKAIGYYNKLGEHEEWGCMGLSLDKNSIIHVGVDSPAQKAGVQVYDKVLSIDGILVHSLQETVNLGRSKAAGTLVTLSVYRKGYGELVFQFPRVSWKKCFIYSVESGISSFCAPLSKEWWENILISEDATNCLKEAIHYNPTNFLYYMYLAFYYKMKKYPQNEILAVLNEGIERLRQAELYSIRSHFYCEFNKKEESIADYQKAISFFSKTDKYGKEKIEEIETKLKGLQCPPPDK